MTTFQGNGLMSFQKNAEQPVHSKNIPIFAPWLKINLLNFFLRLVFERKMMFLQLIEIRGAVHNT